MEIVVLASGSKGNSTYVEIGEYRFLIDLGVSCSYVEKKLKELDKTASSINAVLITHTHGDHIGGLASFYKKYKPTLFITKNMVQDIKKYVNEIEYIEIDNNIELPDINIDVIKTSHDAGDSVGFIINNKAVYITDTGYINEKYFKYLNDKELYIIESNHDLEMLIDGKYPHHLKQRILGDKGHLSNRDTAIYLSKLIGNNTKHIVLAHLSDENNRPEAALNTLYEYISKDRKLNIIVAKQLERTELIKL